MHADATQLGHAMRGGVIRPAIAEEDDVGDLMINDKIIEEQRPALQRTAVIGRHAAPVGAVAAV
ncbi:hypothetical protein QP178_08300 [Sphingomonas aurantiaca]|uniref:hypothetical protein n=1 Tax=Sphingomonas aurantiaca TaxID=185949 RepID=UPI002FDFE49B